MSLLYFYLILKVVKSVDNSSTQICHFIIEISLQYISHQTTGTQKNRTYGKQQLRVLDFLNNFPWLTSQMQSQVGFHTTFTKPMIACLKCIWLHASNSAITARVMGLRTANFRATDPESLSEEGLWGPRTLENSNVKEGYFLPLHI